MSSFPNLQETIAEGLSESELHVSRGDARGAINRIHSALSLLNTVLDRVPDALSVCKKYVPLLHSASRIFESTQSHFPSDMRRESAEMLAEAFASASWIHQSAEEFGPAAELLTVALGMHVFDDKQRQMALYNLGICLSGAGDPRAASDAMSALLSETPDDLEARYNLAIYLAVAGDNQAAERECEEYLRRDGVSPDARKIESILGKVRASGGAKAGANSDRTAVEHYNAGLAHCHATRPGLAVEEFEKALDSCGAGPLRMAVCLNLGLAIWQLHDFQNRTGATVSEEEFKQVRRVIGLYEEVMRIFDHAPADAKEDPEIYEMFSNAKKRHGALLTYGLTKRNPDGTLSFRD